jgi:hypothetical protein
MDNKNTKPKGTFAKLMQSTPLPSQQTPAQPVSEEIKKPITKEKNEATIKKNESSLERKNVLTQEQKEERLLKHHSFDVFVDQLISLDQIQTKIYQEKGKKPKIGTLVQEALDEYIAKYKRERTKVL